MIANTDRDLRVSVVDDLAAFMALQHDWQALLACSRARSPFLTWQWLSAWATTLGRTASLKLLLVHAGPELVAAAPLRATRTPVGLSRLEFLGTGDGGAEYLDVVARPAMESAATTALVAELDRLGVPLRLSHVEPDSVVAGIARRLQRVGWERRSRTIGVCRVIPLADRTWDGYLAARPASHRSHVRRQQRRATERLDLRFDRVTSEAGRQAALGALARFHLWRWHGPRPSTAFGTHMGRAFHERATALAATDDGVRLYTLSLGGEVAGVIYLLVRHRRFFFYQHGFDERFREYSPGVLLLACAIRAALDEGAIEFDLLSGDEPYKRLWADEGRPLEADDLFPHTFRGRLQHCAVAAEAALRANVRQWRVVDGRVG